jgi:hypothetical protein
MRRLVAGLAAAVLVVGMGAGCGKLADRDDHRGDSAPATEQAPDSTNGGPSEQEVDQLEKTITDTESDLDEAESDPDE